MKWLNLLLLGLCTNICAEKVSIGKAFYTSFNVEYIIPYGEEVIERKANCFSFIEKENFEHMLELSDERYKDYFTYGKIKFKDKTYFIDRDGRVSDYQNIYKLKDKYTYEKVLDENQLYCKPQL